MKLFTSKKNKNQCNWIILEPRINYNVLSENKENQEENVKIFHHFILSQIIHLISGWCFQMRGIYKSVSQTLSTGDRGGERSSTSYRGSSSGDDVAQTRQACESVDERGDAARGADRGDRRLSAGEGTPPRRHPSLRLRHINENQK